MDAEDTNTPFTGTEIAIIGMAGRFPGASTIDAFWRNLSEGVESVSFFSDQELIDSGVADALRAHPDYVRAAAVLDDVEYFDAAFFGMHPREADITDPQQRALLECAWQALEHAGYAPTSATSVIGVYAGVSMNTYLFNLLADESLRETAGSFPIALGNDKDYLATRVSYKLNLTGPSVTVQTACSTSLVALHMACQALLSGECDMALSGAVSISMPQKVGYLYQPGGIFAPDGHCRAFDARGQGCLNGNGVGVVALKRLEDALADGDTVHAVIKGSAINNDGAAKVGFTAPSVDAQAAVIEAAQSIAGVAPESVTYIEAHGTGTALGDPIEIAALTRAFRAGTAARGSCAIGSVKTNIGHLDTAAGIAGLIKTVMALKHRMLPPSLHFEQPNPAIDFANSPFFVNTRLVPWSSNGSPRRAGVSSFGIGGTNAHIVLEEAPPVPAPAPGRPWQVLTLSARSEAALETATDQLVAHLQQQPDLPLADVAYTLQVGRNAFSHRRGIVCRDRAGALAALAARDPQQVLTRSQPLADRPVAFLFPGHGVQHAQMAAELYRNEPVFRAQVDQCAELLRPHLGCDLREVLYSDDAAIGDWQQATGSNSPTPNPQLDSMTLAQPALFVIEYALAQLWMAWGVQPQALMGHSIGEYVAACLAGVFSLEDGLALITLRGRLFDQLPPGAMLSIPLAEDELRPLLGPTLSLAAINAPAQCVASGPLDAVEALEQSLRAQAIDVRRLNVSAAAHSALVTPMARELAAFMARIPLHAPRIPFISNVTATWITAEQATDPQYWARHLREPVLFSGGVQELLRQTEYVLLEVGPGQSIGSLVRQQPAAPSVFASLRPARSQQADQAFFLTTLLKLWLEGARVDWAAAYAGEARRRVPLPTYPFERQFHWIAAQQHALGGSAPSAVAGKQPDVADWFAIPSWQRSLAPVAPRVDAPAAQSEHWLIFADESGVGDALAQRLRQRGQAAISVRIGPRYSRRDDALYVLNPQQPNDYRQLLDDLAASQLRPHGIVHCWSLTPPTADARRERFEQLQSLGYYSLLWLVQALHHHDWTSAGANGGALQLRVVSNGLFDVEHGDNIFPEKVTMLGPCKVIPQEFPNIACRCVDIPFPSEQNRQSARLLDQLLAEIVVDTPEPIVAYRGARRWVQEFVPVRLERGTPPARTLRPSGVYLITGGLGNVCLLLAEHLARTVQARLVLVGRSTLLARDEWAGWLDSHDEQDRVSRILVRLQAIEALGAELLIAHADVADEAQLRAVVAQAEARFGALHGVLHAAGTIGGPSFFNPIITTGRAESEQQFQPKAHGVYALANVLRDHPLDFCLLFSSNAAILGGLGFAAYAAANLFLDAYALERARIGDDGWISANWDGWPRAEQPAAQAPRTSMDRYTMTTGESVDAFERVIAQATAGQIVVATGDLAARLEQWIRHPASSGTAASTDQAIAPQHPRPKLSNAYVAPRSADEQAVADTWQQLLGIDQVGIYDNFFELGGHSLLATQVVARLRETCQVDLSLQNLFEAITVAELAALIERLRASGAVGVADRFDQSTIEEGAI